jgi:outer membrane protein TolC
MEQQLRQPLNEWPLHEWDYPRLTLAAWYFHPRLALARGQWQKAEAELVATRGPPASAKPGPDPFAAESLPVPFEIVAPEADVARQRPELLSPPNANLKPPADQPTKRTRRIAQAERLAESARFNLATVAWQVRAGLRANLMGYVAVLRGEALLEELEAAYVKLVKSAESRTASASMPSLELPLLRLQLAQTRLVLIRTRLEKMDSRLRLADSLALPVNALFDVEVEYDFSRSAGRRWSAANLRRLALHTRPDVANALADYTAAEALVRAAIAKKQPHLQLPAGCWWGPQENRWVVSLDLWLPAEARGGRVVARAEARRIAAAARLLNLQTDIMDQLDRGAAAYRVTAEEVDAIDALVGAVVRHYAATKDQFEAGAADPPELLLARMQLVAAGVAKLEAQVKLQNALGALEDAMQLPAELIGWASLF